jgi:hypothetical protein
MRVKVHDFEGTKKAAVLYVKTAKKSWLSLGKGLPL